MKKLTFFLLTLVLGFASVEAKVGTSNFGQHQGRVLSDSVLWKASGSVLLGSNVFVDTVVAGAANDTTSVYDIGGAEAIQVTWIVRAKNDDLDLTIHPFVSPDGVNAWRPLAANSDFDSATPGRADIARDTITQILLTPARVDTSATSGGEAGFVAPLNRDLNKVRSMTHLRFFMDPDMSAGDTVYVTGILTRVFPSE